MPRQRIGELMQEAHLIDEKQIEVALMEQKIYPELKIGQILALHGWLKQETADFFANEIKVISKEKNLLIGTIFLKAGLLSEDDIQNILEEQKRIGLKFGEIAVLKGLLKKETVDFFLKYLTSSKNKKSFYEHQKQIMLNNSKNNSKNENFKIINTHKKSPFLYNPSVAKSKQVIKTNAQVEQSKKDDYSFNTLLKDIKVNKKENNIANYEKLTEQGLDDIPWINKM